MKRIRIIVFLLFALSLLSCAASRPRTTALPPYWGIIPLSFNQVVLEPKAYSTEKGKKLAIKHERNLEDIFTNIRKTYKPSELEFVPNVRNESAGLSFLKLVDSGSDQRFLTLDVIAPFAFFDKAQSTYPDRAATMFTRYLRGLMAICIQETTLLNDSEVAGFSISVAWSTMDAKSVKRGEAFRLIARKEYCENFVSQILTPQEFVSKARIRAIQEGKDLGEISLNLDPTAKAVNTRDKKGFALALYETGTELLGEKKPDIAVGFFDRAIELDPTYSEAYYFRGSAYAALSRRAIPNVVKHDANFNAIRSASCFREIIRDK